MPRRNPGFVAVAVRRRGPSGLSCSVAWPSPSLTAFRPASRISAPRTGRVAPSRRTDVVLGEAKLASGLGRRTMRIKVAKSQRRRLKKRAKLTVRIAATDALGRVHVVTRSVKLS